MERAVGVGRAPVAAEEAATVDEHQHRHADLAAGGGGPARASTSRQVARVRPVGQVACNADANVGLRLVQRREESARWPACRSPGRARQPAGRCGGACGQAQQAPHASGDPAQGRAARWLASSPYYGLSRPSRTPGSTAQGGVVGCRFPFPDIRMKRRPSLDLVTGAPASSQRSSGPARSSSGR